MDNEIIENLKNLKFKPREKWVSETRDYLENSIKIDAEKLNAENSNVTESENLRISERVFKLSNLFNMFKKAKFALTALVAVGAVIVGGVVTVSAANAAVPGDTLYGVDRSVEGIQRSLKLNPLAKAEYEVDLMEERALELSELEESDAESELIEEAVGDLEEQEESAKERIRDAEDNETSEDGELERVRERLETHQEEALKLMQKLQEKYAEKEEHKNGELDEKIQKYKKGLEEDTSNGEKPEDAGNEDSGSGSESSGGNEDSGSDGESGNPDTGSGSGGSGTDGMMGRN